MADDAMRIDPGNPGGDGDDALDAALAAADEGMLVAINDALDLEGRLAQILQKAKDAGEPEAAWPATRRERLRRNSGTGPKKSAWGICDLSFMPRFSQVTMRSSQERAATPLSCWL